MLGTPQGYAEIIDPGASRLVTENDIAVCIHCGFTSMTKGLTGNLETLVFRADGTHYLRPAARCHGCWHFICPRCEGKPCSNRFKRLEQEETEAQRKLICL
jgi:hypothetical protein